ncbi:MAG: TlpA disulfide reductase family protein [Bacteroidota bacterium]
MKKHLKPLLTGVAITLIMALVMLKITMNFQILLLFGAVVFFAGGRINSNNKNHYLIITILITVFYLALFIFIVLKEIPELWYFVLIYFAATLLGTLYKDYKSKATFSLLTLSIIMMFLVIKIIPNALENSLTKTRFDPIPQFSIPHMSGKVIHSESLKGKVVILDFFGTWCKPCIQELKELDKVKMAFKESDDVVFYIINADLGGDTPEKFKGFIEKNNYNFQFGYDHDSKIYKLLGLQQSGLPALLIIDKDQNIRLQHIGYNAAETNFTKSMIEFINTIK